MSELLVELIEKAKALPNDEKVVLVDVLMNDMTPPDAQWEAAWAEECRRRMDAIDRGEMAVVPAYEALAEIRARLKRG
ncbi:MAG: addiction module antitoxin RelB [Betaproteobacteria bacterium]|nr:MAG: addiction module antitoxin RelB [Betaproteobacteria bacterium]